MGVYATNRLASIAEDSGFCQEIEEAFADTSRETANLSNYGIIAQIHENDMRMFDAIISADFTSVSSGKLLEGAELAAVNEKMEKVTGSKIWEKIKEFFAAVKEAIVKVARIVREKVLDLVKADQHIIKKYVPAIDKAASIDVTVNIALPTAFISEIAKASNACYDRLKIQAAKVTEIVKEIGSDSEGAGARAKGAQLEINKINEELVKSVDDIFMEKGEVKITKSAAKAAVDELKTGKAIINATKANADKALKVIKAAENAAKSAKAKSAENPAVGAKVYNVVSKISSETNKAMATVNNALIKVLATNRKIVLAAGRAAIGGLKEAAILSALFESSDMYVAEMCEMI